MTLGSSFAVFWTMASYWWPIAASSSHAEEASSGYDFNLGLRRLPAGVVGKHTAGQEGEGDICAIDKLPPDPVYKMERYTAHKVSIPKLQGDGTHDRDFFVYVPQSVKTSGVATGIMTTFHGSSTFPADICGEHNCWFNWRCVPLADKHGYIQVVPVGITLTWNSGICCTSDTTIDDVQFYVEIQKQLRDVILPGINVAYPTTKRFAVGHSAGGAYTYNLACDTRAVDFVDGVGVFDAAFDDSFGLGQTAPYGVPCRSNTALGKPVWNGMGTVDPYFPAGYEAKSWRNYSVSVLNCDPNSEKVDLSRQNAMVSCTFYDSCKNGFTSELCQYLGMQHTELGLSHDSRYWNMSMLENAWTFLSGTQPGETIPIVVDVASGGRYAHLQLLLHVLLTFLFIGRAISSDYV